jgi:putative lipoic acid-binding regulatory protein
LKDGTLAKTRAESIELLNSAHDFPCGVMVKVIGKNENDLPQRVVNVVRQQLRLEFDPPFRTRETTGGRHVSVTVEPTFDDAEQVLDLYEALRTIEGIVMAM